MMICASSLAERLTSISSWGSIPDGGIRRQVANIVRSRAARVQAHRLNAAQNFGRVLWLNQPDLEIRPRGDLDVAGRQLLRDIGEFAQLKGLETPPGIRSRAMNASLFGVR